MSGQPNLLDIQLSQVLIPDDWRQFISYSRNRIFINPASGCRISCIYCYIYDYGHPHFPFLIHSSGNEIREWLIQQPFFTSGKKGTLISMGSSCDPFDQNVHQKTLELVGSLASLENPIQLSTKYYIPPSVAEKLGSFQRYKGQIIVFATITTFNRWKSIEPLAADPHERLESLSNIMHYGMDACLYIKPILWGVTNKEIDNFITALKTHRIPYCTLGLMYATQTVVSKLKQRGIFSDGLFDEIDFRRRRPPPSKERERHNYGLMIELLETAKSMLSQINELGAKCVLSGPCVTALASDVVCPTHVWIYYPELCIHCSANCMTRWENL